MGVILSNWGNIILKNFAKEKNWEKTQICLKPGLFWTGLKKTNLAVDIVIWNSSTLGVMKLGLQQVWVICSFYQLLDALDKFEKKFAKCDVMQG